MTRRPRLKKRIRQKRELCVHRNRLAPGRVFRVRPNPSEPFMVEVRLATSGRRMRELMNFHEGEKCAKSVEGECLGLVRTWYSKRRRQSAVVRPRQLVARMYLNIRDLRERPSEIVSHECVHAAMGYARLKRARLSIMPGEEVLAHAVGNLVREVNKVCYASKVWP
jgi:hypothetical protein